MKKGILILILLILALFSVSCVCAADVDDAIAISEDTAAMELAQSDEMTASDDSNVMEQSDDEELILEDNDVDKPMLGEGASTGSFTDLDDLINNQYSSNDTITLSCNYTFNGTDDDDSSFIRGISINRGVTIDGKGCTIDGSQKARIFIIIADNVIIKNITFTNGNANGDNYKDRSGGAIHWIGSNAEVLDCTFTHNSGGADGGAIFCDGGRINFFNCTFIDNSAGQGGAIKIYGGDDYHITNCIFTNNNAKEGGAIFQHGYNTTISNSTFTNNNARVAGAIYQNGDNVTISNSIFADNSASGYGGAITWAYSDYGAVLNCIFTNNRSPLGCAIHLFQSRHNEFNVSKCSFVRNTGNYTISLMSYLSFIYSKINNNIFLDNIVESNILYDNQTSDYTNVEINADNNWFGNTASNYAQKPIDNDNIICDSWLFLNGTANPDAVSVFDTSNIIFKLYMYNSSSNNVSEYDNSCLYPVNLTVTATNGNVSKNTVKLGETTGYTPTALGDGGVTASIEDIAYTIELNIVKPSSTLTVGDIVFDYNSAGSTTVSYTNANGVTAAVVNQPNAVVKVDGTKITVSGLDVGTYTLTVTTITDTYYNPVTVNAKITVNRATPKLTAVAKIFKTTDKTKAYTVILKDNKGRAITNTQVFLKVNGITYKATTNAKGVAAFKIAKLTKQGRYTATITYNGNTGYNKATKTVQITVKSAFKTVSKGSKDKATVKKIQVALKKNGYYLKFAGHYLKVDGIFHKYTELAVKQFQKAKGLKVTGKVDEITAKKLKII